MEMNVLKKKGTMIVKKKDEVQDKLSEGIKVQT